MIFGTPTIRPSSKMNSNEIESQVMMPCGLECEHASPLSALYVDWTWCSRPGGAQPVRIDVTICPHFRPTPKPSVDAPSDSRDEQS